MYTTVMLFFALFTLVFSDSLVDLINSNPKRTWTARSYPKFTRATVVPRLGLKGLKRNAHVDPTPSNDLPESFDSRQQWNLIPIRDQASCGSCWAFSTSTSFADRRSVAGYALETLSPADLVLCDEYDQGCNGGEFETSMSWISQTGVALDSCIGYNETLQAGNDTGLECPATCDDGTDITRYKSFAWKHLLTVSQMQESIYKYGPISSGFYVYDDFYDYSTGVYIYYYGDYLGGHAIVVLGWGTEDGVDYWICQNSWGEDWGESGYFRIRRGTDECGIESNAFCLFA